MPRSHCIAVLTFCLLAAAPLRAQQTGGGVLEGFVSTQSGTIRLGGVLLVLHNSSNQEIATMLSDGDGHFRFTALQPGKYTLTASEPAAWPLGNVLTRIVRCWTICDARR